jgi:hypothetical protein
MIKYKEEFIGRCITFGLVALLVIVMIIAIINR